MSNSKLKILISNDDSIYAPGIKHLVDIAKNFGEVTVVAPADPQSGMSHAMTLGKPIRLKKSNKFEGVNAYKCTGTPVDCIKIALDQLFEEKKPDLVLSGINHGANSSSNVMYSGTMAAAMEGAVAQINSIGFSYLDHDHQADFSVCYKYVPQIIEMALQYGFPPSRLLNVNIPNFTTDEIKGVKICRQANARWIEDYEKRTDPLGKDYYWLKGEFVNYDKKTDTDIYALENAYISVVPVLQDFTAYKSLDYLNQNWKL